MRVSLGTHTVELKSWQTKSEMIRVLESCDSGSLLLGEGGEQETEFYSAILRLELSGIQSFGIGICSEGNGLVPHLLYLPNFDQLLFGYNRQVAAVSLKDHDISFTIQLNSLFSSFLHLREKALILVFHEIGVLAMREEGKILWEYEEDVIVDARVDNDSLHLEFMDSAPVSLKLSTRELQYC